MAMKRCPSFSNRPGFPRGLQVLVLDFEVAASVEAEAQLKDCGYSPVTCNSSQEAIQHLANPSSAFDLLLVDVQCLAQKTPENSALLAAAKTLPLLLMSTICSPAEIMVGIKQGAVDFLEKPLHLDKLRNIWQHVVRKMMNGGAPSSMCNDSRALTMGGSGGSGGASVATNGGACEDYTSCAGESGSNESSSERANVKAMELDLETSSLLDAVDKALGNPLAGLTNGFSHLLMGDNPTDATLPQSGSSSRSASKHASGSVRRSKGRFSVEVRPAQEPLHRSSAPGNNSSSSGADNRKPALGYSAGQLPPTTAAGMVWGLPTNPLHISPKISPMGPMPMSMPWLSPLMPPPSMGMAMMMPPMYSSNMSAALPGMMPLPVPPAAADPAAASPLAAAPANTGVKRVDSMPCGLPNFGTVDETSTPGLVHSISSMNCGSDCSASEDLLSALTSIKPQHKPIGLQLKKSMSLMDMISESLKQTVVS